LDLGDSSLGFRGFFTFLVLGASSLGFRGFSGLLQGSFKAPFVYNSKWACGNNHMLSHPVRAMLKSYAIRGPLWSYIHLCQGSFKALQGFFKWTHHHHF
jgi:hypothetical protein